MGIFIEDERQQRAGLFLRDVRYRIHGYFDFIPPEARKENHSALPELWADQQEQAEIVKMDETPRQVCCHVSKTAKKKGNAFPDLTWAAENLPVTLDWSIQMQDLIEPINEPWDLGYMLYDMDFEHDVNNPKPLFFRAQLNKGVINTDRREVEIRG